MKYFNWNKEKNHFLIKERDIGFDTIINCIENGNLIDIIDNPNQKKYKGQKVYIVKCKEYYYIIPFTETKTEIYLITIIPSRKIKKIYER